LKDFFENVILKKSKFAYEMHAIGTIGYLYIKNIKHEMKNKKRFFDVKRIFWNENWIIYDRQKDKKILEKNLIK